MQNLVTVVFLLKDLHSKRGTTALNRHILNWEFLERQLKHIRPSLASVITSTDSLTLWKISLSAIWGSSRWSRSFFYSAIMHHVGNGTTIPQRPSSAFHYQSSVSPQHSINVWLTNVVRFPERWLKLSVRMWKKIEQGPRTQKKSQHFIYFFIYNIVTQA